MEKLILIDGNSILHRAFHALPPFKTSKGELVNAVYGFTSILLNILQKEKPDYIAVSFDVKGKTFRHEEYADYKATRTKAPQELYDQLPRIKEVVEAFDIPIYELQGFEADDVLGTLANQAETHDGVKTYIVTGDKDAFQLITEKTNVITPLKGFNEAVVYDTGKVLEKFGLSPSQITDMKGLQGDPSDNIKGVRGVGQKTARDLLQKYGSIENIYENLDEIKGSVHDKLKKDRENAFASKRLTTIVTDSPVTLNLPACKTHEYDKNKIENIFQNLEFKTLLKRLNMVDTHYSQKKNSNLQATLF